MGSSQSGMNVKLQLLDTEARVLLEDDPALVQHDQGVDEVDHVPDLVGRDQHAGLIMDARGDDLLNRLLDGMSNPLVGSSRIRRRAWWPGQRK